MPKIEYITAKDKLGLTALLEHKSIFPFQGIPVEVSSNSLSVLERAEETFGIWRKLNVEFIADISPISMKVIVNPDDLPDVPESSFQYRAHGDYFIASNGSDFFMVNMAKGEALAFVIPESIENGEKFQYLILRSMARVLVTGFDRNPIHAGGVVRNNKALIFVGSGGAGKSTLCYACVRDGFTLLTDETVYVSTADKLRVWSGSHHIGLRPDAVNFFPELAQKTPETLPSGKIKIRLDEQYLGEDRLSLCSEKPITCVLHRYDSKISELRDIDSNTLVDTLCSNLESCYDLNRNMEAVAQKLASGERYNLYVGRDLQKAVELLKNMTT